MPSEPKGGRTWIPCGGECLDRRRCEREGGCFADPRDPKGDVLRVDQVSKLIHALSYRPERSRPVWRNRHTGKEAVVVDLFVDDNGGFQGGCRRFVVQTDEALPPGPPAPPRKGRRNARCHDLASWLLHWEPVGRWVDWPRPVDEVQPFGPNIGGYGGES